MKWYEFIFGDPETGRASARKFIVYVIITCVAVLMYVKEAEIFMQIYDKLEPLILVVVGFYFGKAIRNDTIQK